MPPGIHALHIHSAGTCEKPDFKSAKGHFNPYGRKHGLKNPDGPHAGDLLNITIGSDGTGAIIVTAPLATLGDGDNSLFWQGGTAIMLHEGPDDYMTDPAGAAGPRIACGVIEKVD
jgi:Cu-Zn family superoxide dismutase